MKKIFILIGILCVFSGVAVVSAEDSFAFPQSPDGPAWISINSATPTPALVGASDDVTLTMFYSHTCPDCQLVLNGFLPQFLVEHPEVKVQYYDTADNPMNKALFASYNARYNRPGSPVPAIFIGDRELTGYEEIVSGLEAAVREAATPATSQEVPSVPDQEPVLPVTPFPAAASFGTFTEQLPGAIPFNQPSLTTVPALTIIPITTQLPENGEIGQDLAVPLNSFAFPGFAFPAASDLTPVFPSINTPASMPGVAGGNTVFDIPFAFPDFTPASSDDSQVSPASGTPGIRLSDGSLFTPFGIPGTEVVFPTGMCSTCS